MNLVKHFEGIRDFRVEGRCLHLLSDISILVLCGVITDCSDFEGIEDYGQDKEEFLREELGLKFPHGIPSEDTLGRVFRYLKSSEVEKSLQSCCKEIMNSQAGRQLSIDGKELRGTIPSGKKHALVQQVSVWLSENPPPAPEAPPVLPKKFPKSPSNPYPDCPAPPYCRL
jgi:hypothetical protein